jgi:hypothetical protein
MSRKFKIIISVLVAVLLLGIGSTSVAMADEPDTSNLPPGIQTLLARVAGILGITEEELVSAFKQAWQEMREDRLTSANITDNGTIHRWWGFRRWFGTDNYTPADNCTKWQEKMNRFRERFGTDNITPPYGWGRMFREPPPFSDNGTPPRDWPERLRERVQDKIQKWMDKGDRMLERFQYRQSPRNGTANRIR